MLPVGQAIPRIAAVQVAGESETGLPIRPLLPEHDDAIHPVVKHPFGPGNR